MTEEAVSPKFTPTPREQLRSRASQCGRWSPDRLTSAGTIHLGHSSSTAPDWLRPPLQLHHSSNSPSALSCSLTAHRHCSRALLTNLLHENLRVSYVFHGHICDTRSSYRKGTLKWDFRSWTTHWPASNEPLQCCSHTTVKTFTRIESG